jgi:hypothetical protein
MTTTQKSWATQVGEVVVSTLYRESSALVNNPPWYFETFAFHDGRIIWQSSAVSEDKAQHQHDVAVRWFGRGE